MRSDVAQKILPNHPPNSLNGFSMNPLALNGYLPTVHLPVSEQMMPGGFSHFLRRVAPTPIPSQREFFTQNLMAGGVDSYLKGGKRYFKNVKENPLRFIPTLVMASTLGTALSIFPKRQFWIKYLFFITLLSYPVVNASRYLPRMLEAYDNVQKGNPRKGQIAFKKNLDELVYRLGHVFLKPISLGLTAQMLLAFPLILAKGQPKKVLGWYEKAIRGLYELTRRAVETMPGGQKLWLPWDKAMVLLEKTGNRLAQYGDSLEKRLIKKIPILKWVLR